MAEGLVDGLSQASNNVLATNNELLTKRKVSFGLAGLS